MYLLKNGKNGFAHLKIDELRRDVESLTKDKVRLDWLSDKENEIGNVQLPSEIVLANVHSLRDAIDAAMQLNSNG